MGGMTYDEPRKTEPENAEAPASDAPTQTEQQDGADSASKDA